MKAKELTKEYLKEIGIVSLSNGSDGWVATRTFKTPAGTVQTSQIRQRSNNGTPSLSLTVGGKAVTLSLARVIYVWYFDDLEEGQSIAYIDGDPKHLDLINIVRVNAEKAAEMAKRTPEQCAADWEAHKRRFLSHRNS